MRFPTSYPEDLAENASINEAFCSGDLWDEHLVLGVEVQNIVLSDHIQHLLGLLLVSSKRFLAYDVLMVLSGSSCRIKVQVVRESDINKFYFWIRTESRNTVVSTIGFRNIPPFGKILCNFLAMRESSNHFDTFNLPKRRHVERVGDETCA
jgi:hypothetical protein